jgi:hypothetical protein
MRLPADKRPNILIYDKVNASGGRKAQDSYYKSIILATNTGKKAMEDKQKLEAEVASRTQTETPRPIAQIETDKEDETGAINQMLSAIRTAAKLRIQLNKIKRLKNIDFEWIREDYEGDDVVADDADMTLVCVPGLGKVRKSTKVLWFKNKDAKTSDPFRCGVQTFLRWQITDEMMDMRHATLTGEGPRALINSPKMQVVRDATTHKTRLDKPTATTTPTTPTLDKARDVKSLTDLITNMDAIIAYMLGVNPAENEVRYKEFKNAFTNGPVETVWTGYQLFTHLTAVFADQSLVTKAREFESARRKAS